MRRGAAPAAGRLRRPALVLALLLGLLPAATAVEPADEAAGGKAPARFRVTEQAISPGFGPFAATAEGFGAGSRLVWAGSGFEPTVVRTRWSATADAPDRILVSAAEASHWDTLREGALDGARVDIYRVADGRLDRVRVDRIAAGGHAASGWTAALPEGMLIPPGETAFDYAFAPWSRPGAEYWFALQAVGTDGQVSAPSAAVRARSPEAIPPAPPAARLLPAGAALPDPAAPAPAEGAPEGPLDLAAAPTADGALRLTWRPGTAPRPAGWRLLVSDTDPAAHRGFHALLEGGAEEPPIRAGDLAILSKTFDTASRKAFHANRVWGAEGETALTRQPLVNFFPDEDPDRTWRLVRHAAGTPVEDPGETYLELSLARGASARIGAWNHAGTGQHWYEVLEPGREYVVEFWARADRTRAIRLAFDGPYGRSGPAFIRPKPLLLQPEWRRLAVRFTPPVLLEDAEPGWMGLEIEGEGTFAIDNLRIRPADTPWLDFEARDYDRLATSGAETIRTHGLVKTFRRTYDLGQLTNPGGVTGIERMNTLPQTLGALERAGVDPWLQIEPHLSPEEWQGLVEYLAAPAPGPGETRPWAAKRAAQGRAAPWTEAFGKIHFEIGNETWNGIFAPWTFPPMPDAVSGETLSPGAVYGLFQEQVIRNLRSSPWWKAAGLEDKAVFVLGGWAGMDYGRAAAEVSPASDLLAIAAYNGGWDAGEGPPRATPEGFFQVLNDVSQSAIPDADRLAAEAAAIGAARGRPLEIGTYEAGPGYALDGLNGDRVSEAQAEEQERVMKSAAAGAATLDAFLARAERGFGIQTFYAYGEGRYWRSHARWVEGGQAYPSWALLAQAAAIGRGEALAVETLAVPEAEIPATAWRPATPEAPLVGLHAAREGDRVTVTAISRRVPGWPAPGGTGETEVVADLPFARAARATRHRLTGGYAANNVQADEARLTVEPLPEGWLSEGRLVIPALSPGAAEILVFEGVSGMGASGARPSGG